MKCNATAHITPNDPVVTDYYAPRFFIGMLNLDFQNCTVRPTIHFLEQPPLSENAFIWPHAVQLPLCGGSCGIRNDILACRGNTKVPIKMPAYKVFYHSSRRRRDVMEEFAKLEGSVLVAVLYIFSPLF
jgi:hypothetical protein